MSCTTQKRNLTLSVLIARRIGVQHLDSYMEETTTDIGLGIGSMVTQGKKQDETERPSRSR